MDQYVSQCMSAEDLSLDVIWANYEDFCKPQIIEVRARFDLLTSFRQGYQSFYEWYNAVQAQMSLAKYPPENASILHGDIFWFFLKDGEFVSKTINDSNIDTGEVSSKQNPLLIIPIAPKVLIMPTSLHTSQVVLSMCTEPLRAHISAVFSSFLSDLMRSTASR